MRIKVFHKKLFSKLIKRGTVKTNSKLETALFKFKEKDYSLDYSESSITNDLKDHDSIRFDVLVGLTYLILEDHKAGRPNNYTIEDFQKVFAHLNKSDLLNLGESKRESYDQLIKKLVVGNKEFEGIYLSKEWEIKGGNSKNIDNYINFVQGKDSLRGSDHQIPENSEESLFWKFYRKNRLRLAYVFGFIFVLPGVVIPIVSIGIYRALTFIKDRKKRRKRIMTFVSMLVLTIAWIVFLNIKLVSLFGEGSYNMNENAFDTNMLGAGMVTIHNTTQSDKGKNLGLKRTEIGEIGDTIIVSVLVANKTNRPIENIKVELSPRNSGYNKKHIFHGMISGFNVGMVEGTSSLATYEHTRMRSLDSVFIQRDNGKSKLERPGESEVFSLFNGGMTINKLYPGAENFMSISALYIIEREEPTTYAFHPDPSNNGTGILSINDEDRSDVLSVKIPSKGNQQIFTVHLDYQNITHTTLTEAKAIIKFEQSGKSERTIITGMLKSGYYSSFQSNETYLDNLPSSWKLELLIADAVNTHGEYCGEQYQYTKSINLNELMNRGVSLPILDTNGTSSTNGYSGACSQGHIVATFRVINTEKY